MVNPELNINPLRNALSRLEEGIARSSQNPHDDQLRDGLIQRFEFTYEISHKILKRFLEMTSADPAQIDAMTFQDLIRTANERGLLKGNWHNWKQYRDMRAKTSHTYAEEFAIAVVDQIPAFLDEALFLLGKLDAALR